MPEKIEGPTFHDYMRAYSEDHQNKVNKACHMIGIPLIVASLPVIPVAPPIGLGMFGAGWTLQFVGHVFEGKKPSFTRDLRYLAIGPVWIAVEWARVLTGKSIYKTRETPRPVHSHGTNGTNGVHVAA